MVVFENFPDLLWGSSLPCGLHLDICLLRTCMQSDLPCRHCSPLLDPFQLVWCDGAHIITPKVMPPTTVCSSSAMWPDVKCRCGSCCTPHAVVHLHAQSHSRVVEEWCYCTNLN